MFTPAVYDKPKSRILSPTIPAVKPDIIKADNEERFICLCVQPARDAITEIAANTYSIIYNFSLSSFLKVGLFFCKRQSFSPEMGALHWLRRCIPESEFAASIASDCNCQNSHVMEGMLGDIWCVRGNSSGV